LNSAPDTHWSYEDRAVGGAGIDVLIGNTGGDRLIDWVGEFNTYLVPFAPFGEPTISDRLGPGMPEFLYALSKSNGADPTLAAQYGGAADRNGEPFGEIALVLRQDAAWDDQRGAPRDPQSGNIPGGPRDVLRTSGNKVLNSPATTINTAPQPLAAAAAAAGAPADRELTVAELEPVLADAKADWLSIRPDADFSAVAVSIGDLPDLLLGQTLGQTITVDATAAGWGWSISYPDDPAGHMDLRTVLLHELGHVLGLEHAEDGVMAETLAAGEIRHAPSPAPWLETLAPGSGHTVVPAPSPSVAVSGAPAPALAGSGRARGTRCGAVTEQRRGAASRTRVGGTRCVSGASGKRVPGLRSLASHV
jgi:Matrixin